MSEKIDQLMNQLHPNAQSIVVTSLRTTLVNMIALHMEVMRDVDSLLVEEEFEAKREQLQFGSW